MIHILTISCFIQKLIIFEIVGIMAHKTWNGQITNDDHRYGFCNFSPPKLGLSSKNVWDAFCRFISVCLKTHRSYFYLSLQQSYVNSGLRYLIVNQLHLLIVKSIYQFVLLQSFNEMCTIWEYSLKNQRFAIKNTLLKTLPTAIYISSKFTKFP